MSAESEPVRQRHKAYFHEICDRHRAARDPFQSLRAGPAGLYGHRGPVDEVETSIRLAIQYHILGLRGDGATVPLPVSRVNYVAVSA